jgi:hypothetical protein
VTSRLEGKVAFISGAARGQGRLHRINGYTHVAPALGAIFAY